MAVQEHQNGEEKQQAFQEIAGPTKLVDKSRRSFTKSGLVASGVLLTLASRPVLGDWACHTPSGFVSGNVSSHGTPPVCSGQNPLYYRDHPEAWPDPPYSPGKCKNNTSCTQVDDWIQGTTFDKVVSCNGYGAKYKNYSMMQVIFLDHTQLGAYIVAAIVNARKALTPVLTEAQVINIFNEWDLNSYFEPTAGVKWYEADIVNYLKTTMTL
ncbi:hypothetical protein MTYP_02892 [Methylophilaceae bacterium]|nr:hypothetical protein MTYP_02892 [Methylophilaceae bacterium]